MEHFRGEAGDLRLGIRRAARPRNSLPESIINNQNYYPNVLSHVANAIPNNGMFNVVYSPRYCDTFSYLFRRILTGVTYLRSLCCRASHSNFIVPYQTYLKCTASPVSVGTRFKMKYDMDGSQERRLNRINIMVYMFPSWILVFKEVYWLLQVQRSGDWSR